MGFCIIPSWLTISIVFVSGDLNVITFVYSGLPNPEWPVRISDPGYKDISELLLAAKNAGFVYSVEAMPLRLGFTGFVIAEGKSVYYIVGSQTTKLQEQLLKTAPEGLLPEEVLREIETKISTGEVKPEIVPGKSKRYVPPFHPAPWQGLNFRARICNNCYNYANMRRTDTFAHPGRGGGYNLGPLVTIQRVRQAAQSDGLVYLDPQPAPVEYGLVNEAPVGMSLDRHLVAFTIRNG